MPTPQEISDWLDDMALFSDVQVWDAEMECWVWEDTGEPVDLEDVRVPDDDS